jgi:hypothetical protein
MVDIAAALLDLPCGNMPLYLSDATPFLVLKLQMAFSLGMQTARAQLNRSTRILFISFLSAFLSFLFFFEIPFHVLLPPRLDRYP